MHPHLPKYWRKHPHIRYAHLDGRLGMHPPMPQYQTTLAHVGAFPNTQVSEQMGGASLYSHTNPDNTNKTTNLLGSAKLRKLLTCIDLRICARITNACTVKMHASGLGLGGCNQQDTWVFKGGNAHEKFSLHQKHVHSSSNMDGIIQRPESVI